MEGRYKRKGRFSLNLRGWKEDIKGSFSLNLRGWKEDIKGRFSKTLKVGRKI